MGEIAAGRVFQQQRGRRDYHGAWWSLALYIPFGIAAFLIGEGLASLYGYDGIADDQAPTWLVLAAGYPALLVFVVPAFVTTHFARRAMREGIGAARLPLVLAWIVALGFTVQNVVAYLVD
jgi:hypothetical protein